MAKKVPVRLMAPFSMRCTKCQHFIYKNTKFNARKTSTNEVYLDIRIVRLSFRCSNCSNEIILSTDPKSRGYRILSGGDRNLDPVSADDSPFTQNTHTESSTEENTYIESSHDESSLHIDGDNLPETSTHVSHNAEYDSKPSGTERDTISSNAKNPGSSGRIRKPLPLPKKRRNVAFDR